MRLAIHSASASVRRTLESAITHAGHHLTTDAGAADIVVVDTIHPLAHTTAHPNTLRLMLPNSTASADMLTCPLRPHSLIQRLMMLSNTQTIPLAHGWTLDMQARSIAHTTANSLTLTEKECALLKHLAAAHPDALTREDLLEQVWGMAGDIDTHTLETHIYRLRAKLEPLSPNPCDIVTQDGAYVLALGEEPR